MSATFEQAREFFTQGLAHYEAGRFAQAERDFTASLALVPARPSTLTNLGATKLKLGRVAEASELLREALEQEPDNLEALGHRATALAELGLLPQALVCVERALSLEAAPGVLWTVRGNLLKELGRVDEARNAFQAGIEHGADAELSRYYLASLGEGEAPRNAPRQYVEALFDGYAEGFEEHLVKVLNYHAPDVLTDGLARMGRRFSRALDLGCGTGLCGPLVRPLADELHGVDLSHSMVEQARARGVYDAVWQDDIAAHLRSTSMRYDLVLAADVFIYVGALEEVFAGVAGAMDRGGVFCFSIESTHDQDGSADFVLRPSLRYAHSAGYIRKLAEQYGFEISATQDHPIRDDQRTPIPGVFAWLIRR
jgi:predicted TPR repeat methyltransferase